MAFSYFIYTVPQVLVLDILDGSLQGAARHESDSTYDGAPEENTVESMSVVYELQNCG
jgi:hypothetical protein